jgi:hypothetical protein
MFDRWHGSQEGNDQSDQAYHLALTAFYHQVQSVISGINDVYSHLSPVYPQEAFSQLSFYFEGISREFDSYTRATSNIFYAVVRRSSLRTAATKSVSQQARIVAKLFEKYFRNPKSYSAVDSRLAIHRLHDVLENLLSHCI